MNSFLSCNPLHPPPIGMQLYLVPSKAGAWFKKKSPLGKISFLVDWPLSERAIKCQQASWPEDDVKPLRFYFFIHLFEAPDFDKGQDCWPPHDSVFIPMYNKRYISKPKNKEMGSVSGKTDSPMSFFLAPRFFLAEFPSGAWVLTISTYFPRLLSSMWEGAQGGAPSDIQMALVAQRRWCKFLVLEFYWYLT